LRVSCRKTAHTESICRVRRVFLLPALMAINAGAPLSSTRSFCEGAISGSKCGVPSCVSVFARPGYGAWPLPGFGPPCHAGDLRLGRGGGDHMIPVLIPRAYLVCPDLRARQMAQGRRPLPHIARDCRGTGQTNSPSFVLPPAPQGARCVVECRQPGIRADRPGRTRGRELERQLSSQVPSTAWPSAHHSGALSRSVVYPEHIGLQRHHPPWHGWRR